MLSKLFYKISYSIIILFKSLVCIPLAIGVYKAFKVLKIKTLAGRLLLAGCLIKLLLLLVAAAFQMDVYRYVERLTGADSALTMKYWMSYSLILNLIGSIGLGLIVGSAFADRNQVPQRRAEDKIHTSKEPASPQEVAS